MTVEICLTQGLHALVDDIDAASAMQFKWYARRGAGNSWYGARTARRADGSRYQLGLHTFITGYVMTDHVNGNGLDNRRTNLRLANATENNRNVLSRKGSSVFKGVRWVAARAKWRARVQHCGRDIHLGYFADEAAAAFAYDAAARELFGNFAAFNFPMPGERSALASP